MDSLGCALQEMLAGVLPFTGPTPHLTGIITALRDAPAWMPCGPVCRSADA